MADGCRWVHFQYLIVPHADEDGFSTIQAIAVDTHLSAGKEPAHG